jgi:hypothetical protein
MTIAGGAYMFMMAMGLSRGTGEAAHSHWPTSLMFAHGGLATSGAALWAAYMIYDDRILAWISFAVLLVVAGLGEVLFSTWFKDRRAELVAARGGEVARVRDYVPTNVPPPASGDRMAQENPDTTVPVTELEERRIPAIAVAAHGLLAVLTILLVLIESIRG